MKKSRKIFTVLSLLSIFTILGLISIQVSEIFTQNKHPKTQLNANIKTEKTYYRNIPDELMELKEFDYKGLHYVFENESLTAFISKNPLKETELILYYSLNNKIVQYSNINWSAYTNLENVVVVANTMYFATLILKALPSGVNLYTSGSLNFESAISTMPFENIYLSNVYMITLNSYSSETFTKYLINSNIKHIYYNYLVEKTSSQIEVWNNKNYKNKQEEIIQMEKMTSPCPYPEEVFYPFSDYNPTSPVFGSTGYYLSSKSSHLTQMEELTFIVLKTNEQVKDVNVSTMKSGNDLENRYSYGTVYMPNNTSYNFSSLSAEEVVISVLKDYSFVINYFSNTKSLRFLPTTETFEITASTLSSYAKLKKIWIPTPCKDKFSAMTSREDLIPLIEYYDESTYETPTNSYLEEDGTLVKVKDSKYTIEEIKIAKQKLQTLEIPIENKPVDEIMEDYEFPIKNVDNLNPIYSIRKFDTIIVPKTMNVTKIMEAFKKIILLNHNQISDSTNLTITCDTTNDIVGTDKTISITIQLPNGKQVTQDIFIKSMDTNSNIGYILDGDDIYIITNQTKYKENLVSLLNPLMEHYLSETSVEYQESPILNTKEISYNAANFYQSSQTKGRAKVLISSVPLTETEEPTIPEEPTNTEGYVMKEIDKIYTPSTIDGKRLLSQLREYICTQNGIPYSVNFIIGYNEHDNLSNYSFTIYHKFSDSYTYQAKVEVEIIEHPFKMGFILFKDGTIATLFNYYENFTKTQIETNLHSFLTARQIDSSSLSLTQSSYDLTKVYEENYLDKKLLIVNSGVNLAFTAENLPTDETEHKKGYVVLEEISYTNHFTLEQALRALGKNLLLKDGLLITDYEVSYKTQEGSTKVEYILTQKDQIIKTGTLHAKQIDSEYAYIFAKAKDFDYGYLIMSPETQTPTHTLNTLMMDIISQFRALMRPFQTHIPLDFTKQGKVDVDGIYQVGNGSYYSYEYNVEILDIKKAIKTNEITIDGQKEIGISATDKIANFLESFKTKFKENKAVQAATIIFGSLLGLFLAYGVYILFRKTYKWLKK